jgi:cation transport ATPase
MALNVIAVSLSIAGILDPVSGAIFHNAGSVFVVFNSLLLLFHKDRK